MANIKYEIIEELETIQESEGNDWVVEVNKISWGGKAPQIDIRRWNRSLEEPKMGKGINLTDEGVNRLVNLLIQAGYGDEDIIRERIEE